MTRCSRVSRFEIQPHSSLKIEKGADRAAVERLYFGIFQRATELAFPFRLDDEPVDVAAIERLRIPDISVLAAIGRETGFEPLDQYPPRPHTAILASEGLAARRHGIGTPDGIGSMAGAFERSGRYLAFRQRAAWRIVDLRSVLAVIH